LWRELGKLENNLDMEIHVNSQEEKDNLIKQSQYIHDFVKVVKSRKKNGGKKTKWIGLDSDKAGTLMHIYLNPDMIVVKNDIG